MKFVFIYYKNMCIEWVLEKFNDSDITNILKNIPPSEHIKYFGSKNCFVCKSELAYKKLEKILMQHYYDNKKKLHVNLIKASLINFLSDSDNWENLD